MNKRSHQTVIVSHLKIFPDRSVLVDSEGKEITFLEGSPSESAKKRWRRARKSLDNGWLDSFITDTLRLKVEIDELESEERSWFEVLANSVTSEVGRAVVGVTITQLIIKALEPGQSIRLHKSGRGQFSWAEGFPMRSLAAEYVTSALRKHDLLRGNIYGPMMTRSLAENYPYGRFYKAAIRGAKSEWVAITEALENGRLKPEHGLRYLLSLLINRSEHFNALANQTVQIAEKFTVGDPGLDGTIKLIMSHIQNASYASRLLEVAMHALVQVARETRNLEGDLRPLCQMRTANKKHRNVGDIEIVARGSNRIIEAWDAKFGQSYLKDVLDELGDKLEKNTSVKCAGFVTDSNPKIDADISKKIEKLQRTTGAKIAIIPIPEWVRFWVERIKLTPQELSRRWIIAYTESLCQKRRDMAPIDEPCDEWVANLKKLFEEKILKG